MNDQHSLGNKCFKLGEFTKAYSCYTNAITEIDDLVRILSQLATVYYKQREWCHSIQYSLCVIALNENRGWIRLGLCLEQVEDYSALKWIHHHLDSHPGWKRHKKRVGKLVQQRKLISNNRFFGILSQYFCLVPRHACTCPSYSEAINYAVHGRACVSSGQNLLAIEFYSFALEYFVNKQVSILLSNRAAASLSHSCSNMDFQRAFLSASAAVTLDPKNLKAHYRRTKALVNMGQFSAALLSCKMGQRQAPDETLLQGLHHHIHSIIAHKKREQNKESYYVFRGRKRHPFALKLAASLLEQLDGFRAWATFRKQATKAILNSHELASSFLSFESWICQDISLGPLLINRHDSLKWWSKAEMGDFNDSPLIMDDNLCSFSNLPFRKEYLTKGNHISIQNVDLCPLLFSEIMDDINYLFQSDNAYHVSKTLIICEMLQKNATVDQILQVWFSTGWTRKTLHAFKQALSSVIGNFQSLMKQFTVSPEDVMSYLSLWQLRDVSLCQSFKLWFSQSNQHFTQVLNFCDKTDQLCLAKYKLTGCLGVADVGSIVMWGLLPNQKKDQESILHVIQPDILQITRNECSNIIEAAIIVLQNRITVLMQKIRSKKVGLRVIYGNIDNQLKQKCRDAKPVTIHWGSLCDKYSRQDFQKLTSDFSIAGTVHFSVSGLWSKRIKGASLLDYRNCKERQQMLNASRKTISTIQKMMTRQKMVIPIICNPLFYSEHCLSSLVAPLWSGHFFKRVGNTAIAQWSFLTKYPCIIHVTWTHDANLFFENKD